MKRLMFTMIALILTLPILAAAGQVGGPFEIYVDLVDPTGNDVSLKDLSLIDVNIDSGFGNQTTYINETGMLLTDFHFDVGPLPGGTLGDFIWEDASSSDFMGGDSFFDVFFEVTIDNRIERTS